MKKRVNGVVFELSGEHLETLDVNSLRFKILEFLDMTLKEYFPEIESSIIYQLDIGNLEEKNNG